MAKINDTAVMFKDKVLEPTAKKMGLEWHSQKVFGRSVVKWFVQELGIKDEKNIVEIIQKFEAMPSGFGTNASQFNQSAGRISREQAMDTGSLAEFVKDMMEN